MLPHPCVAPSCSAALRLSVHLYYLGYEDKPGCSFLTCFSFLFPYIDCFSFFVLSSRLRDQCFTRVFLFVCLCEDWTLALRFEQTLYIDSLNAALEPMIQEIGRKKTRRDKTRQDRKNTSTNNNIPQQQQPGADNQRHGTRFPFATESSSFVNHGGQCWFSMPAAG